ncbi:MAG: hypothetical protein QGF34_04665 [Candidatus Poseidoniaceae archaeon]|nr:hypothetical protein [Candidatus Poseidoniaceae archaeon]
MSSQFISNDDGSFLASQYGPHWAGPDGDRLTLAIRLLNQVPPGEISLQCFEEYLEFTSSVSLQAVIETATNWKVNEKATTMLHTHSDEFIVGITSSIEPPTYPTFDNVESDDGTRNDLRNSWQEEVSGVSQGAYVSQAQHMIASASRLGLRAQTDKDRLVWPPRQLNGAGERIQEPTEQLSKLATILTWTRLSAAGAPSEFSGRAPILGGVSTVLVEFEEGPKGVFMLADDESKSPEIDGTVRFEVRRLYGQDGLMHYGLKAILC